LFYAAIAAVSDIDFRTSVKRYEVWRSPIAPRNIAHGRQVVNDRIDARWQNKADALINTLLPVPAPGQNILLIRQKESLRIIPLLATVPPRAVT